MSATLVTEIAVKLPDGHGLDPRQMLDAALLAVLRAAGEPIPLHDVLVESHDGTWETQVGQGLPAWTTVRYDPSGPYAPADVRNREVYPELYEEGDEYGDQLHHPACTYLLDFDTEDSYRSNHGQDGAVVHGRAVELLQEWLATVGGSLKWRGQYIGSWHTGDMPTKHREVSA
ncbi:hypothetical protein [Mycobacteroides abscessus]|uniref:hypothetical protein n=1 Tax=Mycobacteroides abscessus TaxID=36809 RepID=UPI000C25821D|nr:hypothetical protein [Mycobacteroides abscessus]